MNKSKRILSSVALILILAMVIGTIASALMGCGAVEKKDDTVIRIGGMKGATTIGLVNLVDKINKGEASNYSFEMYTAGSDVMAAMVAGEVDIATVPANVACVMNTKVEGGVSVIDINTLGVLNCISAGDQITGISDLSGKTVYATGQGAVPEYTIRYLLEANGVTDCNLEFKSEPTEIVSIFAENPDAVAILPQPFVTAALAQNESLKIAFDLNDEWNKVNTDCKIVTGVTVAANSFIRSDLEAACALRGIKLYLPPLRWCGDNGAMIGAQGYYEYLAGRRAGLELNAYATMDLGENR